MVKIIAELCQNHNGDVKLMSDMVAAAAEAGVDLTSTQAGRNLFTFRNA